MDNSEDKIYGRVYKIVSSETPNVYVGSTVSSLSQRFSEHRTDYKKYINGKFNYISSFELMKFVDVKIELLHEGFFDTKADLHRLEGQFIQSTGNCINKLIAGRTKSESDKAYRETHKEEAKAYGQEYRKKQQWETTRIHEELLRKQ